MKKATLKQHRKFGVFMTPVEQPIVAAPTCHALGATPTWAVDSEDNVMSWWDVFTEMARECAEFSKAQAVPDDTFDTPEPPAKADPSIEPGPVAQKAMRYQLPVPVKAWKSKSENDVCILLDDDTTLLMSVRQIGSHWISVFVSQRIWTHWRVNKAKMKALGFRAKKENGRWQLSFHAPETE